MISALLQLPDCIHDAHFAVHSVVAHPVMSMHASIAAPWLLQELQHLSVKYNTC